ncbi:MAG TPA: CAP domain-containing protein [Geomonas sp.]
MGTLIKTIGRTCCIFFFLLVTLATAATQGEFAQQVLAETNLARTAPQRYAGYLRELRRQYRGKSYPMPGTDSLVMTSEGVTALDEAVRYLQKQAPLPPLAWSPGLAESAADLVSDQGQNGEVGHTGSRSGDTRERIERYGTWLSRIAENIGYGPSTPRLMVMQLIIDDGVPGRGHRKNIFTRSFKVAGATCGPHPQFRNMCAMEFAVGFRSGGGR